MMKSIISQLKQKYLTVKTKTKGNKNLILLSFLIILTKDTIYLLGKNNLSCYPKLNSENYF